MPISGITGKSIAMRSPGSGAFIDRSSNLRYQPTITPEVTGNNLLANGDFEGADLTMWAMSNGFTIERDNTAHAGGTYSAKITRGTSSGSAGQSFANFNMKWYRLSGKVRNGNLANGVYTQVPQGTVSLNSAKVTATEWGTFERNWRSRYNPSIGILMDGIQGQYAYLDDLDLHELSLPSMLKTVRQAPAANFAARAYINCNISSPVGLVVALDSEILPKNYVGVYINGSADIKVFIEKNVNATYTDLFAANPNTPMASWPTSGWLDVIRYGNDFYAFYAGAKFGPGVTVSDAGIVNNTKFCQFSASNLQTFSGFTAGAITSLVKVLPLGDSKTEAVVTWPKYMTRYPKCFVEAPKRLATGGWGVANLQGGIDAYLATAAETPDWVAINIGVNDFAVASATWKTDLLYVIDACRTKWSTVKVIINYPWKRDNDANAATRHTDIDAVITARSTFCYPGIDEAIFTKGSDNGATMTYDGIHYTDAGAELYCRALEALMV
jgi:hypothetical protein